MENSAESLLTDAQLTDTQEESNMYWYQSAKASGGEKKSKNTDFHQQQPPHGVSYWEGTSSDFQCLEAVEM